MHGQPHIRFISMGVLSVTFGALVLKIHANVRWHKVSGD